MADIETTNIAMEESTPLIALSASQTSEPFSKKFMALMATIAIISLFGVVSFNQSATGSQAKISNLSSSTITKTSGRQPVTKGCVNIYGSNYLTYPQTDAIVICSNVQLLTSDIDTYGFAPWDRYCTQMKTAI